MVLFFDPRRIRLRLLLLPAIGLLACATAAPLAAQATFVRVGDMTVGRNSGTAQILPDGRVLVLGGSRTATTGSTFNKEADIYDPTTTAFTATGAMSVARFAGSSVRLNDGRVAVIGGRNDAAPTDTPTAEIYDPAKGTFAAAGTMALAREEAVTAVLKDGRVLVLGGVDISTNITTRASEILDPATGTFTAGPRPLAWHTGIAEAVTMSDGRVLVFGTRVINEAGDALIPDPAVEVFDPVAGIFDVIGELNLGRDRATATLLPDGTVAVSGGFVLNAAGTGTVVSNSVEVFDPVTGKSTVTGTMSEGRVRHVAVALADGRLLLAGGTNASNSSTASAEVFDPKTGKVTALAPMTESRTQAAAVRLQDGSVLIMGGARVANGGTQARLQTAELFKP